MDEAKRTFLEACDLARKQRMPESFALAALGYSGSPGWARAGGDGRVVTLLEEALGALGRERSALRVRLLARLAGALRDQPSLEPRSSLAREAVAIARELGEPDTLVYALTSLFMAVWGPAVEELVEIADEVSRLAEESGLTDSLLDALTLRGVVAWLTSADAAVEADDAYSALAAGIGEAAAQWQGAMQDGLWALHRGDFAGAEKLAEQALRSGGARSADADCSYRLAMFVIRRAQGRLAEIEDLVRDAADRYPGYRSFRCFIPVIDRALGRTDEARYRYEELAQANFGGLPRDSEWLFCLALIAELADHFHDQRRAALLYRLLQPYPSVTALAAGEVSIGPVARYLGIVATTTAEWDVAQGHFESAVAMSARTGGRPLLALTQGDYARMLAARGRADDVERARELRVAAEATCRALGMQLPDTLVTDNTREDTP
jgi:tetratricopeptide (TPR) repeat protein